MNLIVLLEAIAGMRPAEPAISDLARVLTYEQLLEQSRRWGGWIDRHAPQGVVLYLATMRVETAAVLFGASIAGASFVPVNYRVKADEMAFFARTAEATAIVHEGRYASLLAWLDPALPAVGLDSFTPPADVIAPLPDPLQPAVRLFTSGTSGTPRLVPLTHDNLGTYILNTVEPASAGTDEATLLATPPYHVAAIAGICSNLFRGRRIVLQPQFDPVQWLETVRAERISHAMVVPTMLARILDTLDIRPDLVPQRSLNLVYGGSSCPPGLVERALSVLPSEVDLVNAYGLTETSSTVCILSPQDHRTAAASHDPAVRSRLHSVGRPVPGVVVRIARLDGSEAAPNEPGQILIRGSQVMTGYVGQPVGENDGWLYTGDGGYMDEDGYVFVTGRLDDTIIRGGENIDPAEIEAALLAHPAVREAAVVGLPDPEWGQVAGALVLGDETIDDTGLREWLRSRLPGFKVPTVIRWAHELPRNDIGKVVRRRVADLLLGSG